MLILGTLLIVGTFFGLLGACVVTENLYGCPAQAGRCSVAHGMSFLTAGCEYLCLYSDS